MTINIELTEVKNANGEVIQVCPKVNCNIALNENYSIDYLRPFIQQWRDLLDVNLNKALKK